MEWQLIETAPKNCTEILAFCPDEEPQCVVVKWVVEEDSWEGWAFADEALYDIAPEGATPTHWMPLPEAPNAKLRGATDD